MKKPQTGFTLVEIAIVLLIVGLLLGGVLKGQELIDSAKAKNLAQDLRSIPAMVHAYQDKFRALPGDDPAAVRHLCSGGDTGSLYLRLWPHVHHTDGFFAAVWTRKP